MLKKLRKLFRNKKNIIAVVLVVVVALVAVISVKAVLGNIAKNKENEAMAADLNESMGADLSGYLQHGGNYYEQNEDITSILVMGVDTVGSLQPKNKVPGEFGQADTIMLVLIDKKNSEIRLINVVRDSMVNVTVFDTHGEYARTDNAQLCLQYAYGDGGELSCQLTANQVSEIFYNMPINYYVAINKTAMKEINDAIGGVPVTMSQDWQVDTKTYAAGETVTLKGDDAMGFLFSRESKEFASNMVRVTRQQDYLKALISQLKAAATDDIGVVTKLYSATSGHMYSNISLADMVSLAKEVLAGGYSIGEVQVLPGQYVEGEAHDEYYYDKDAVYDMVLQNYYSIVDMSEIMGDNEE